VPLAGHLLVRREELARALHDQSGGSHEMVQIPRRATGHGHPSQPGHRPAPGARRRLGSVLPRGGLGLLGAGKIVRRQACPHPLEVRLDRRRVGVDRGGRPVEDDPRHRAPQQHHGEQSEQDRAAVASRGLVAPMRARPERRGFGSRLLLEDPFRVGHRMSLGNGRTGAGRQPFTYDSFSTTLSPAIRITSAPRT
jgi:hypothetical protein